MKRLAQVMTTVFSLIFLWQTLVSLTHLPDYILPTPWQVFTTLYQQKIILCHESLTTIAETLVGLLLGILFGSMAAFSICFFRGLRFWFWPLLIISQAIPTFAVAPLFVLWLGYGLASKIMTCIMMIFFPVTSALYDGLQRTPREWLDLAQSMQASRWLTFKHVRLPAALPAFASGVRIAAVTAPIGAVAGEWVGASHGLGYIMLNANARMQIDVMFAALIVIILLALLLYFLIDWTLRLAITWQ